MLIIAVGNGARVRLGISDKGSGIAPADAGKLFRRSFTTKPKGMDIGLVLAKRAIESLGGRIRGTSPPGGIGASFIIELPGV